MLRDEAEREGFDGKRWIEERESLSGDDTEGEGGAASEGAGQHRAREAQLQKDRDEQLQRKLQREQDE